MSSITDLFILAIGILLFPGIYSEGSILKTPEIHSLHIYSDIRYRYATTTVTSRIKNVDQKSREAVFNVTLPNEAFITNLTLEIDGKIILGEIKEKQAAKKQYQEAQQRGESAGYIGTRQRETNNFNLAVTVAAQSKVSFNLTYQELLKRKLGQYEQVIYIDPGQPVPDMSVTVAVVESREITHLSVPPLRNDLMTEIEDLSTVTVITRPTPKTANVKFVPSLEFQTAQSVSGMAGQFVLQYDVEREMDLGDVLVVNGYFVHFFAPDGFKPIPKDVLFILDTSGSMMGTKLNQLKQAMKSIVRQLVEGDRMNIMTFSGSTSFWKTEMVDVKPSMLKDADKHIDFLTASGWTDIEMALVTGVTFLNDRLKEEDFARSPVVVFLTDGEATSGVTDTNQILMNLRKANYLEIPVFSLAFGENADYDIVKKISIQNNGLGRKIYEASDAAMQIARLYDEISVTLLNNITFQYLDAPVANVTKHEYTNYFNGTEVVICGRLSDVDDEVNDTPTIRVTGNGVNKPGLVLTGAMSDNLVDISFKNTSTDTGEFEKITEKVWAYLTIKQLLDKELATSNEGEKESYKKQILDLSIKYGFVTPLTSMVVTLPKKDTGNTEGFYIEDDVTKSRRVPNRYGSSMSKYNRGSLGPMTKYKRPGPMTNYKRAGPGPMINGGRPPVFSAPRSVPRSRIMNSLGISHDDSSHDDDDVRHLYRPHSRIPKKGKRKPKKKQKKQKGARYPLRAKFQNLDDPVCFNLYDNALETAPEMYNFYSDNNTGLKIDVKLERTILGKWTEQGGVKEIHLTSGDIKQTLTSKSIENNTSADPDAPWKIFFEQTTKSKEIRVELDAFTLVVTTAGRKDYLYILVQRTAGQKAIADSGIIGQVFAKKLHVVRHKTIPGKVNKKGKKTPRKEKVILKLNKEKFALQKRKVDHSSTLDTNNCFPIHKHEIKMLNIKAAKIV